MANPVDVALVRLAVSRGLLSPSDGQHMESLHQQGQGTALQLLEARGLATHDLQRSFGGTPFGCTSCGFSCAANQLNRLTGDLRCPHCGQASLAPGRSASGRMPVSGSSYVRPTGTFNRVSASHDPSSDRFRQAPPTGSYPAGGMPQSGARNAPGSSRVPPPATGAFAARPSGAYPAPRESGRLENSGGSNMPRSGQNTVIRAGSTIGGYLLGRELGRGACGHVFLARRPGLSREFAVKVLRQEMLGNAEAVARFFREADVASKLSDPGVVSSFDVGQDGAHCFYAMDYCPGQTLKERMRERPYSIEEAVDLVQELARIQEVAHAKGVVHRDFKPSNIILAQPDGRPRVTDFGLARDTSTAKGQSLSRTGDLIGTPIYMSPEQLLGERADVRADVYALGVIFYELVCGKRPFEAATTVELASMVLDGRPVPPRSINPAFDPALEKILLKALAKERGDRFPSGGDLEAALRAYKEGNAPQAPARKAKKTRRTQPNQGPSNAPLVAVVVAAVVLLLGVGGYAVFASHQAEQERLRKADQVEVALGEALDQAKAGEWESVSQQLLKAVTLADELEQPELVASGVHEVGTQLVSGLAVDSTPQFEEAQSRLDLIQSLPGYDRAPQLDEQVNGARALLTLRANLASIERSAGEPRPYSDLQESLRRLQGEVDDELKPYVQVARLDMALRRCKLREAEALADKLLSALRLPPAVEREARLGHVVSLVWQEKHEDAVRNADALATRWPDEPEGLLGQCLSQFSRGELGPAQDQVTKLVERFPQWLPGKLYGSILANFSEDGPQVRDWLSAVNQEQPDNRFLLYAAGLAANRVRAMSEATQYFDASMEGADPPLLDAMVNKATMLLFSRRPNPRAVGALLTQAEALYPSSGEPRFFSAIARLFQATFMGFKGQGAKASPMAEEAVVDLQRVKQESPGSYKRSIMRLPGNYREGVTKVIAAKPGEALDRAMQIVREAMGFQMGPR